MKFKLLCSAPKTGKWCWEFTSSNEIIAYADGFADHPSALESVEEFHLSLAYIPIFDESNNLLKSCGDKASIKGEPVLSFMIRPVDEHSWFCFLLNQNKNVVKFNSSKFDSQESAVNWAFFLGNRLYTDPTVVDTSGIPINAMHFSSEYCETFGLVDDHPSMWNR